MGLFALLLESTGLTDIVKANVKWRTMNLPCCFAIVNTNTVSHLKRGPAATTSTTRGIATYGHAAHQPFHRP